MNGLKALGRNLCIIAHTALVINTLSLTPSTDTPVAIIYKNNIISYSSIIISELSTF